MTTTNRGADRDWDDWLKAQDIPPEDAEVRRAAIEAATERFRVLQKNAERPQKTNGYQALLLLGRLIKDKTQESLAMCRNRSRTLIAALASAGVTALALFFVLPALLFSPPAPEFQEAPRRLAEKVPAAPSERYAAYLPPEVDTYRELATPSGGKMAGAPPRQARPEASLWFPPLDMVLQQQQRDEFKHFEDNTLRRVADNPLSTFSIDVDTASYSFVRRMLNQGILPEKSAVRAEELINYFDYDYPVPEDPAEPFSPSIGVIDSPWAGGKKLVHIGIKGYDLPRDQRPRANLVFLLDISGSMNQADKLPLVKQSMEMLLEHLDADDTVAIVTYASGVRTLLEPTPAADQEVILNALQGLRAGGATAGGGGLQQAYQLAERNVSKETVNRVILATDGDFNVGISDSERLKEFVERKRESGIFLSVLGFGQGNYQDRLMQALAQNGNGVAAYIDNLGEARKVLVREADSTLFPIARDVKIQVEFNPDTVAEYRLIGYETRALKREDFNNDAVDAGDVGAGHSVTAFYEITPVGSEAVMMEELRYGPHLERSDVPGNEYGYLKMRYKLPGEARSRRLEEAIRLGQSIEPKLRREIHFAAAVAAFAQKLRGGTYLQGWSDIHDDYEAIIELAEANKGADPYGDRTEFIELVRKAKWAREF